MLASTLRLGTVVVLCVLVVRDILRPERDAVRQTYADDPDGGVLDGAPDAPWITALRGALTRHVAGSGAVTPQEAGSGGGDRDDVAGDGPTPVRVSA